MNINWPRVITLAAASWVVFYFAWGGVVWIVKGLQP